MAGSRGQGAQIRRSNRRSIPSSRAQQYQEVQRNERPSFPAVSDVIKVKWVVDDRSIWWPATVLSIASASSRRRERSGKILYHKLGLYQSVENSVTFSFSGSNLRFVTSIGSGNEQGDTQSSWIYFDEHVSDSEDSCSTETEASSRADSSGTGPVNRRGNGADRYHQQPRIARTIQKRHSSGKSHNSIITTEGKEEVPPADDDPSGDSKQEATLDQPENNSGDNDAIGGNGSGPDVFGRSLTPVFEETNFGLRLQLLEHKVQVANMTGNASVTSSTLSVIVSLRWALLRALERPLKNVQLPSLDHNGLAHQNLSVNVHCDYYSFREIASMLAQEHRFACEDPKKSRVAFSPGYNTIQSGSSAVNDLNIVFTCLGDLTSFLRIRDENDFESILTKEVVTENQNLLRILGTFTISETDQANSIRDSSTGSSSTISVSVSSESVSAIRLFVGSSPVNFFPAATSDATASTAQKKEFYQSIIFEQECKHFCLNQKCYRTPWKPQNIQSTLTITSPFHMDGTIERSELDKYFLLNWSRQPSPSHVKWTKDVQDVGINTPGILRLSLPSIFFSSRRSVRSLVSLFDKHIETFMKMRSYLHNNSSFR